MPKEDIRCGWCGWRNVADDIRCGGCTRTTAHWQVQASIRDPEFVEKINSLVDPEEPLTEIWDWAPLADHESLVTFESREEAQGASYDLIHREPHWPQDLLRIQPVPIARSSEGFRLILSGGNPCGGTPVDFSSKKESVAYLDNLKAAGATDPLIKLYRFMRPPGLYQADPLFLEMARYTLQNGVLHLHEI